MAFLAMGIDGQSLITACVMSTPCSLALSKMRYPETEDSISKGSVEIPKEKEFEANVLHAAGNGAAQGIHLAALIAGSLLVLISLFTFVNEIVIWLFSFFQPPFPIDIPFILSYVFSPLAAMLGVPFSECLKVGSLLGIKMAVNEFVAYTQLSKYQAEGALSPRGSSCALSPLFLILVNGTDFFL